MLAWCISLRVLAIRTRDLISNADQRGCGLVARFECCGWVRGANLIAVVWLQGFGLLLLGCPCYTPRAGVPIPPPLPLRPPLVVSVDHILMAGAGPGRRVWGGVVARPRPTNPTAAQVLSKTNVTTSAKFLQVIRDTKKQVKQVRNTVK